ncbi:DUF5050 domain-containing protein [Sporosarcina sp. PTS2304]|uniref:DUF5050 domain-containing protein n=1 Tax=Sporosarcina sp. PTS2304 TaxID=2283194 RepID=UPI000E0D956E|nr:DUF5050 domain-containing protein [Sporosarcina sp. PTS2304]AXI01189.1 DUF5050 domain-containing protein [Sporosarcina sp. PTS2304]
MKRFLQVWIIMLLIVLFSLSTKVQAVGPNVEKYPIVKLHETGERLETQPFYLVEEDSEKIERISQATSDWLTGNKWGEIRTITDPYKEWSIHFNQSVNVTEENTYRVKILDESGEEILPIVSLNKDRIKIKPGTQYEPGVLYTLLIQSELDNHRGIQLGKNVYLQFIYNPSPAPSKPEITEVTDLYSAIYNGLKNLDDTIDVSDYSKDSKKVFAMLEKVLYAHPDIFYFSYAGSSFYSNGHLEVKYTHSKPVIQQMSSALKSKTEEILARSIRPGMTEYEKVKALHNDLVLHTAYDYENFKMNRIPAESYTIYGTLIKNTAVCQGYALTMIHLLNQIGIESIYVRGTPAMNHAWNKVKIDGEWYNLDATWDDPVPDRKGKIGYGYFLVTDQQLAKTHSWKNTDLPTARNPKYEHMSRIWTFEEADGWIYYANNRDDIRLYKMRPDGTGNQKLSNNRANELTVYESWIFFSNYSNGGYLFKMRIDGSSSVKITDFLTSELHREGNILYFKDQKSGQRYRMEL